MRLKVCISTVFVVTTLFGFRLLINPVHITGHLKKNPKDSSAYVERIEVIVKGDNKILASTITDMQGDFEISFTPGKEKSFDFFVFGIGVDTMLIGSVKNFESDNPEMTFYAPALRKKNANGKMLCPKCVKADKVYEIRYAAVPVAATQISENGDTTYSPIVNGHFYAGTCIASVATYYCDRDSVKF